QGAPRDYRIEVLDTGNPANGVDTLSIYGTDASNDTFLASPVSYIPTEHADRPAFVALLHDGSSAIERVNYDTAINGRLQVFGLGGNETFAIDDAVAPSTFDGGTGNDTFQLGQLFGTQRDDAHGGLAPEDVFATVPTTRGWLSTGPSAPLTAL